MTGTTTQVTVDGVPTLHAPGRGTRYRAGLLFRVGRADETLATTGITHLVEHLALFEQGVGELHFNGATADLFTHFHVEGSAQHVVDYFASVCAGLRDLPLQRLEVEKQILQTEQSTRGGSFATQLPMFRHGAQGYGLSSYPELGLPALTPETVAAWATENFTRDNAVLWVVGDDVPEGLHLDLPRGRARPTPPITSALPRTPAWYQVPGGVLVMHALVPRATEGRVFAGVLGRALYADLRQRGGYSYTAQADYHPLDRDRAAVMAVADSAPDKRDAVAGAFVDVLARLRLGTVEPQELDIAKRHVHDQLVEAEEAEVVPGHALNLLLGHPVASREELLAEVEAVDLAAVRRVASQVWESALIQTPTGGLDWAGLEKAPVWSAGEVVGREYPPLSTDDATLVVGDEGVSLRVAGHAATVRYADCAVLQSYPDGGLRLVGRDGFTVAVEPSLHQLPPDLADSIVRAVPPSVVVRMAAREPDHVPRPSVSSPAAHAGRHAASATSGSMSPGRRRTRKILGGAIGVLTALWLVGALGITYAAWSGAPDADPTSVVVTSWIILACLVLATWALWPRRGRPGRG